jgi:hypothetical protein
VLDYKSFKDAGINPSKEFKEEWITDSSNTLQLMGYCNMLYTMDSSTRESLNEFFEKFAILQKKAIKSNNITSLEIVWKAIYHDRDNPDFEQCLYDAAEFGNLEMFEH